MESENCVSGWALWMQTSWTCRKVRSWRIADANFGLLEALEEVYGRPVDLVTGSAIYDLYFLESV